jgi:RimJ/RimL family protein N-acetyltransferase
MLIEGGELRLRPWHPTDAPAVCRAAQDPQIPRYTTLPSPYALSDAEKFVGDVAPAGWAAGTSANFAVLDATDGTLLGSCGLVWIRDGQAELGYWTAAAARGRGVALRASRLVCRYAFAQRGIERISWQAEIGNHPSRLVALRAGFHLGGTWQFRSPSPGGGRYGWLGTLLPGQLTEETPTRYAAGSLVARRARVLSAEPPHLALAGGLGRLRAPAARDVAAVTLACQHPSTARWTTVPVPYRRADAEEFIGRRSAEGWALGTAAVFAVADADDAWVGNIDLRLADPEATEAEVGYLVAPGARGRGYATAALRAVTGWAFDNFGVQRIRWRAEVGNDASRRVAEKAGFQLEGVERGGLPGRSPVAGGARRDAWVGGLLADDPR